MVKRIKEFIIECMIEALRRYFGARAEEKTPEAEEPGSSNEEAMMSSKVLKEWLYGEEE